MTAGDLGCITTPRQDNARPPGARWAADNGRFGKGWPGAERWWTWLTGQVHRYGPDRCLFAVRARALLLGGRSAPVGRSHISRPCLGSAVVDRRSGLG